MIKLFLILFITITIDAKIIEVSQLFNKKIVSVKSEQISIKKTFYAKTMIDESRIYDINLRFSGFIEKLYVNKSFTLIAKDDKLFSIYSKTLSNIKEELDLAKRANQKVMVKNLEKKLLLLNINSKITPQYTLNISSPTKGLIIEKNINQGSFAKKGQTLYKIADLSKIWVIAKAYQDDISFIKKGLKATISIEGLGEYESEVDYIYPFINPKSQTFDIRLVIENPNYKIFPNLFAKVRLRSLKKEILTLPRSSILTKGDKHFVFKPINKSEFKPISIIAKRLDSNKYEIIKGLKADDKVIDNALFLLDSDALTNALYDQDLDEEW